MSVSEEFPGTVVAMEGLRAVNLSEFLEAEFPPRENVLAPIIPTQGLVLLYAPRGIGKTQFGLGIAYAVAVGGKFLRWEAPKPRRVLYVDGEMPAAVMQERFAAQVKSQAAAGKSPPDADYLKLITPDMQPLLMPDISSEDGQAALRPHLDGVELIVVDNLSTLSHFGKENEAESWLPVQEWALGQRREGRSILFIHHAGKGGQQRGTSRREDVLDTVISLKHPSDYQPVEGCRVEVHIEKARGIFGEDVKPFEAKLEMIQDVADWSMKDLEETMLERVIELHKEGNKQRDIAIELGVGVATVNRHIKKAKEKGLIS